MSNTMADVENLFTSMGSSIGDSVIKADKERLARAIKAGDPNAPIIAQQIKDAEARRAKYNATKTTNIKPTQPMATTPVAAPAAKPLSVPGGTNMGGAKIITNNYLNPTPEEFAKLTEFEIKKVVFDGPGGNKMSAKEFLTQNPTIAKKYTDAYNAINANPFSSGKAPDIIDIIPDDAPTNSNPVNKNVNPPVKQSMPVVPQAKTAKEIDQLFNKIKNASTTEADKIAFLQDQYDKQIEPGLKRKIGQELDLQKKIATGDTTKVADATKTTDAVTDTAKATDTATDAAEIAKVKENVAKAGEALDETVDNLKQAASVETDAATKANLLAKADEASAASKSAGKLGKLLGATGKGLGWVAKAASKVGFPIEVAAYGLSNANYDAITSDKVSKLGTLNIVSDVIEKGIWGSIYGTMDLGGKIADYVPAYLKDLDITPEQRKANGETEVDKASRENKDRSDNIDRMKANTYAGIDKKLYGEGDRTKYLNKWGVEDILPEDEQEANDKETMSRSNADSDKYQKAYEERTSAAKKEFESSPNSRFAGATKVILKNGNTVYKFKPDALNPNGYQIISDREGALVVDTNAAKVHPVYRKYVNYNAMSKDNLFNEGIKQFTNPNLFVSKNPESVAWRSLPENDPTRDFKADAAAEKLKAQNAEIQRQNDYAEILRQDQAARDLYKAKQPTREASQKVIDEYNAKQNAPKEWSITDLFD